MENYRALWAAVVLQARDDIAAQPIRSLEYGEAIAFLTHGGAWAESRANVAGMLDLHGDDIRRSGERWIKARRKAEGLPEIEPPPPPPPPPAPRPRKVIMEPIMRAIRPPPPPKPIAFVPVEIAAESDARPRPVKANGRVWKFNPFNPLLRARR